MDFKARGIPFYVDIIALHPVAVFFLFSNIGFSPFNLNKFCARVLCLRFFEGNIKCANIYREPLPSLPCDKLFDPIFSSLV